MNLLGLDHVAFAHWPDSPILEALDRYLGLRPHEVEPGEGFRERMIRIGPGDVCLQALEGTEPGVVERFLERRGPGLHHVAFVVGDLEIALRQLSAGGARLIDSVPRPGGGGSRIAFIHPETFGGLLVELVERAPSGD